MDQAGGPSAELIQITSPTVTGRITLQRSVADERPEYRQAAAVGSKSIDRTWDEGRGTMARA
jgi:hypothetical protein